MRLSFAVCSLIACLFVFSPAKAHALSSGQYWDFAAARAATLEPRWSEAQGAFISYNGPLDTRLNSTMLDLYSMAALDGKSGMVRRDARARRIVDLLTRAPAYVTSPKDFKGSGPGVAHYPGWTGNASGSARGEMHMSIDPKVAAALAHAWQARAQLGLSAAQAQKIQTCISQVARSALFRFPTPTLNQWNWATEMWVHYAQTSGDWKSAGAQYRAQLQRFISGVSKPQPGMKSKNLNSGLGFMYGPEYAAGNWPNLSSSTEYGNIVYSGLDEYDRMVAQGMPRLTSSEERVLRDWSARMMYGEWTHSGYTNWDSGLGLLRWHLMRYWAWSMDGLLALAQQDHLRWHPQSRAWSTWIFDRSLELYNRWSPEGVLPGYQFDIPGSFSSTPEDDGLLNAARFAVLAATAARNGLGQVSPVQPPAMWAHDPDTKRLVVSTPRYSAGLSRTLVEQNYGGAEINRFIDSAGNPLSGVGGNQGVALGVTISRSGEVVFASQPRGVMGYTQSSWKTDRSALRGTFSDQLGVSGSMRYATGDKVQVEHRFDSHGITTLRQIYSPLAGQVEMYFPVWGDNASARVGGVLLGSALQSARGKTILFDTGQGGHYAAQLLDVPVGSVMAMRNIATPANNPHVRKVLVVSFPISARQTIPTTHRILVPED